MARFPINTIFYAAMLWLLLASPEALRRAIRRRRGRCFKCGYDLRGAAHEACPECGNLLKPGSTDTPSPALHRGT